MNTNDETKGNGADAVVESSALLADLSIWTDEENGGSLKVKNALEVMTDEWIDGGNYCAATVADLRDALKKLIYG